MAAVLPEPVDWLEPVRLSLSGFSTRGLEQDGFNGFVLVNGDVRTSVSKISKSSSSSSRVIDVRLVLFRCAGYAVGRPIEPKDACSLSETIGKELELAIELFIAESSNDEIGDIDSEEGALKM